VIEDKARQLLIQDEVREFNDAIWSLYPDKIWLNSPAKMQNAAYKLGQLKIAHEIGFTTPDTVISSNWEKVSQTLLQDDRYRRIIVKMIRGVIIENGDEKAMGTTILSKEVVENLHRYTVPFPGIYQPYIEKSREWRVTVVGDEVFPAAIYTSENAKDDWRKHQLTEAVTFKAETLPEHVSEKCIHYLGKMGLRFGAFDFVEQPDGEIVFLECNPNGQYAWLEESLGFPISQAIAGALIAVAKENKA
jgi:glutathione synthase/RimK-type ligase-like ATP-grasp enzyme